MSMSYTMILVPEDPYLRPTPASIAGFLSGMSGLGSVGQDTRALVRDYQKGTRRVLGRHPQTGKALEHFTPATIRLNSLEELPAPLVGLAEFDAVITGTGPVGLSGIRNVGGYDLGQWQPLQRLVESGRYVEDYEVRLECCQRARLISTSDLHTETQAGRQAIPFGEPCELSDRVGLYSHPETIELIQVPNAGCTTFWIAYRLGTWMFPGFSANRIDFAEPKVLQWAQAAFGTPFAEGCFWS